jgi:hypothetical protein
VAEEKNKEGATKDFVTPDREANIASSKAQSRISDHFKSRAVSNKTTNKTMEDSDGTGDKQR